MSQEEGPILLTYRDFADFTIFARNSAVFSKLSGRKNVLMSADLFCRRAKHLASGWQGTEAL